MIGGPGCTTKDESKAKANYLISIANSRKDCTATISPHKADVVEIANSDTQTDNVVAFYAPLTSSSYAVFDTGYKYMYDRFNDKFRYIPTNGDVAGLMVRTNIQAYPWFSPAGSEDNRIMQLNLHSTHPRYKEIVCIQEELTLLLIRMVLEFSIR